MHIWSTQNVQHGSFKQFPQKKSCRFLIMLDSLRPNQQNSPRTLDVVKYSNAGLDFRPRTFFSSTPYDRFTAPFFLAITFNPTQLLSPLEYGKSVANPEQPCCPSTPSSCSRFNPQCSQLGKLTATSLRQPTLEAEFPYVMLSNICSVTSKI